MAGEKHEAEEVYQADQGVEIGDGRKGVRQFEESCAIRVLRTLVLSDCPPVE